MPYSSCVCFRLRKAAMDLDIARVIKSIPKKHEKLEPSQLVTTWGEELSSSLETVPLAEHPRPQFARRQVWVLNGWWQYAFVSSEEADVAWQTAQAPKKMQGQIRVPFSPEAWLSGVGRQLTPNELLWYRCRLGIPQLSEGDRCILHFDGVDNRCAVYLGKQLLGIHEGAYQPFSFDVTDLFAAGESLLEVCVYDPSETGTQLRGKQRLECGGMWYTAQSGIWQTVWLEVVPQNHIEQVRITADADRGELVITAWVEGNEPLAVSVFDDAGLPVAQGEVQPTEGVKMMATAVLSLDYPRLWTPDDPYLYRLRLTYGKDEVQSYCAFRTISVEKDARGVARLCLNHEPFFFRGLLDQGYWPDGLMTPPADAAMVADIQAVRDMGFNMVRKHIKVEPERWYWHCDRLGLLVWQDMPSGGANPSDWLARNIPTLFKRSWQSLRDDEYSYKLLGSADEQYRREWTDTMRDTITRLSNHPCIVAWVLFNESWGQFDAGAATQKAWELDATRPVLSASGWYDQGTGDIHGVHNYFRGMHMFSDPFVGKELDGEQSVLASTAGTRLGQSKARGARAQVISEMGGLTWHVAEHSMYPVSYGYADFDSEEAWQTAVAELLDKADLLENDGLSGFVYTQLTDVEEETNGLLSYDRRVRKLR